MPTYKYTARDQEGKNVAGRISAENESVIVAELRKRNLIILSIAEEKESVFKKSASKPKTGKKSSRKTWLFLPASLPPWWMRAYPFCNPWKL